MDVSDYSSMKMEQLVQRLKEKDELIRNLKKEIKNNNPSSNINSLKEDNWQATHLNNDSIARYSRQLILPEFGPSGQLKLQNSSILIVGCGGLGCPAAIYVAAAGIGRLGLVDYDVVEISNLHRQILHTEGRVGVSKSESIAHSVKSLNSRVHCVTYDVTMTSSTINEIMESYDVVLDCTDNVATRYLLNDACVLNQKPLISGSALRFEGQLTVYNYNGGPCYRCLFPRPPPPETVTNCSDGGVMGVVPGIIGCLQALEAIKLIANIGTLCVNRMLVFDGLSFAFRVIKLRESQPSCELCGTNPTIKRLVDYEQFCGTKATDKDKEIELLEPIDRLSVQRYKTMLDNKTSHLLIDIRMPVEIEICKFGHSINIPLKELEDDVVINKLKSELQVLNAKEIVCICRKGNDSQKAVCQIKASLKDDGIMIRDIVGGLTAWAKNIDKSFPIY